MVNGQPRLHALSSGFTMIELMLALVMSSLVAAAVYGLVQTQSTQYRQIKETQTARQRAQLGNQLLEQDLRRVGFMTTLNSEVDGNICPKPTTPVQGIVLENPGDSAAAPYNFVVPGNSNANPDALMLFVTYGKGALHRVRSVGGTQVTFESASDPDVSAADPFVPRTQAEFDSMYRPWHLACIVNSALKAQCLEITSSAFGSPNSITLAAPPASQSQNRVCGILGDGSTGHLLAPAGWVRYTIKQNPADPVRTDLVREEVTIDAVGTATPIANTEVIVAAYGVDFQVRAHGVDTSPYQIGVTQLNMTTPPQGTDFSTGNLTNNLPVGATNASEQVRIVDYMISVRAPAEEAGLAHAMGSPSEPITTYDLDSDATNSAPVSNSYGSVSLGCFANSY